MARPENKNPRTGRWNRIRIAVLLALVPGLLGLAFLYWPLTSGLEERYGLDLLFKLRGPVPPPPGVCVVAIDDASYLEYAYEERDFDFTQVSNNSLFEDYVETRRLRPEVRLFLPMGFFAVLRGTRYNQEVQQFDDLTSPARSTIEADFWIGDLQLGYRLPKRWGSVVLNAYNFNNEKFEYYLSSLEENVVPARTVTLGVNFTSH